MRFLLRTTVLAFASLAANATTVENKLFSLDVPDSWIVENSRPTSFRAFGQERVDGGPSPLFTASHCFFKSAVSEPGQEGVCQTTCDEEASLLHSSLLKSFQLSEPIRSARGSEITFTWEPIPTTDLVALSCNRRGRILLILQTEWAQENAKSEFSRILKSLIWK